MAQQFLSVNRGQLDNKLGNVVTGTSAPSADFYVQILTTNNPTRKDTVLALQMFIDYILDGGVANGAKGTNLPPN